MAGSPVTDNSTGLRELGEIAIVSDGAPGAQGMGSTVRSEFRFMYAGVLYSGRTRMRSDS